MDSQLFEKVLIHLLFVKEDVRDRLYPFLSTITVDKIFSCLEHQHIVKKIIEFKTTYDNFPSIIDMKLTVTDDKSFTVLKDIMDFDIKQYNDEHLLSVFEKFFKEKLIWNELVNLKMGLTSSDFKTIGVIPDKIREALAFSFDTSIGLDFAEDADRMYDYLHNKDLVISTGIKILDSFIEDGFHEKSLTLFLGMTNVGKTLVQCAFATNALIQNKNVLYISLEENEDKLSKRFMCNLFDQHIGDLKKISKKDFVKLHENAKNRIKNLVIKEYPGGVINANHIRSLLKELQVKKNFTPDIVFIDYIGCMIPNGKNINTSDSNEKLKNVTEEVRSLSTEFGFPIVSALQTNRSGFGKIDMDLTQTAESIGSTFKADIIVGISQNADLKAANIYNFVILKNRYGEAGRTCQVGVDKPRMRLFNVEIEIKPDQEIVDPATSTPSGAMRGRRIKKMIDIDFNED